MLKEGVFLGKRYEILGRIGSGGMADVYKGKDHKLNRYVAIKVLKSDYRADQVFIQKFLSEAQAAGGLMHPNVVNVYDVGQDRGLYYMVMELVEGITLKDYIIKKGQLSAKETISISIQMVTGIQAAHSKNIVHRDIKPQNIIISKDGKVKVTDFGIARATTSSNTVSTNVMGSVHYTSPEHARGGHVNEKSDIYSAGITMYEMITGHVPFDGDSTVTVALKHLQENMISPAEEVPEIPYSLECIILKCTDKNPEHRYPDCQSLIMDLKRSLVDPEGDFVKLSSRGTASDETVVMSPEELQQRMQMGNYDDDDEDYDDDEEYDDDIIDDDDDDSYDDKPGNVDPNTKKIMKILMVVAAVIAAFTVIFLVGRAAGLFRIPSSNPAVGANSRVAVPNLVGMTEAEAKEALKKVGLGFYVSARKASDKYDSGVVMEQETAPDKKVDKNTTINVIVSTGKTEKKVQVPNVVGKNESEAAQTLQAKKLIVESDADYSDTIPEGNVISTNPPAGTEVPEGTKVKMVVSLGRKVAKSIVPDLLGMSRAEAENAIVSAGLTIGSISESYDDSVAAGLVISQTVPGGKEVEMGTFVSFVVSRGAEVKMVIVPALSGMTEAQARSALSEAGLTVGDVDKVYSNTVTAGYVISQTAGVGSSVPEGTVVGFVVSQGTEPLPEPEEPGTEG